jgi:DNA helicase II / ATP-dependent DNA helicase PcrA
LSHSVIAEELDLLAKVSGLLSELPEAKTASEAPIVRELERLREVILSGDEAKDISALSEQYHHQAAVLAQLRNAGGAAQVDRTNPYFAHLRLREEGRERDLCLGRTTCIERGVRIVDWRDAPISKIFYSYRQGDEYDEEIAGRERIGLVTARRTVRIENGALQRVQAPEGDFVPDPSDQGSWQCTKVEVPKLGGGEGIALRAFDLGEGASRRLGTLDDERSMRVDKRLPEITGLIDPDQFELITHGAPGFLVIRGAAGSGKTTVALHRVAYLAFSDPRIDSPETMVVVFSRALQNFVSHVLPSLGLGHVQVVGFPQWALEQRRWHFRQLPAAQREDTPALIQRIKLHPFLGVALTEYIEKHPAEPKAIQAIDDWATVLREPEFLEEVAGRVAPGAFSPAEIAKFVDWHRVRLGEVFAALQGEPDAAGELDPEDDALLLRAWQLRVGPLRGRDKKPLAMRHLVVDEVQDFAPIEIQLLLGSIAENASITLAGDTQQHVMTQSGFTSWSEFFRLVGISGTEIETLRVAYRSSRQIVDFSASLLGDLLEDDGPPDAPREGPPVELFRFADRGACVAFLADALHELARDEPLASVAILTPSRAISSMYFEGLERSDIPRLRWVQDHDFSFSAGVEVAEIEQVKGLEFDYVILVDVEASLYPDTPESRRRLHVGATRAIHQLWLTSLASPSPLVEGVWQG